MSEPCCIREPIVNQKLFRREKVFSKYSVFGLHGWGLTHSYGEKRASTNRSRLTPKYAVAIYTHTSNEKGARKENSFGLLFVGFLNKMLMPRFINGIVKSTTSSLSSVIVRSAIARSTSCNRKIYVKNCLFNLI